MLFDKQVQVKATDVDRYDRLVARISVEGKDSSLALLQAGLACHFTRFENDPALAKAQLDARANGRGFWAAGAPKPGCVKFTDATTAAAPPSQPRAAPTAGPFHGNRNSRVYHAPACRNYNCKNCTAVFKSADEAQKAGYRPAGDCLR